MAGEDGAEEIGRVYGCFWKEVQSSRVHGGGGEEEEEGGREEEGGHAATGPAPPWNRAFM